MSDPSDPTPGASSSTVKDPSSSTATVVETTEVVDGATKILRLRQKEKPKQELRKKVKRDQASIPKLSH